MAREFFAPPVIKPCPLCGYADVVIDEITPLTYSIGCPQCDSVGPSYTTVYGAITMWNNRVPDNAENGSA